MVGPSTGYPGPVQMRRPSGPNVADTPGARSQHIALVALAACVYTPTYRVGVFGVLLVVVVATLYFLLFSRNHLVPQAPEEAAAISMN